MSAITHIEIPIADIILLDKNPRKISEEQLDKLCEDIQKDPQFLIQSPPLVNLKEGGYYCYVGTQRIKACEKLGHTVIKCFVEENVPVKVQDEHMGIIPLSGIMLVLFLVVWSIPRLLATMF